jgi:voltage-gated potassium channel
MQTSIKKKVFELIDPSHAYDDTSRAFNIGMLVLISLNIVVVILETEAGIYSRYRSFFEIFDAFSVGIFTIEFVLRLWSCTEHPNYKRPVIGRLRYAFSPSMLIDLISILPFYVPLWGMDLRFIRAIRLFRLFRLMKMMRYSQSLTKIVTVIKSKKEELSITLFAGAILLIIASSLLYFIEHNIQPDSFGSIPAAMWWGVVTLTTVGYGDVYPTTVIGKIIGALIAVLGIGLFALPAGIIASGFASELHNKSSEPQICPHCGKDITQPLSEK